MQGTPPGYAFACEGGCKAVLYTGLPSLPMAVGALRRADWLVQRRGRERYTHTCPACAAKAEQQAAAPAPNQVALRVEQFLAATGTHATRLGRDVMGDPNFVADLRAGRKLRRSTLQRLDAYITQRTPGQPTT